MYTWKIKQNQKKLNSCKYLIIGKYLRLLIIHIPRVFYNKTNVFFRLCFVNSSKIQKKNRIYRAEKSVGIQIDICMQKEFSISVNYWLWKKKKSVKKIKQKNVFSLMRILMCIKQKVNVLFLFYLATSNKWNQCSFKYQELQNSEKKNTHKIQILSHQITQGNLTNKFTEKHWNLVQK